MGPRKRYGAIVASLILCAEPALALSEAPAAAFIAAQAAVTSMFDLVMSKFDVTKQMANANQAANQALNRHTLKAVADAKNMAKEERAMRLKSADLARAMEMPPNVCETAVVGLRAQSGEDNSLRLSGDVATAMAWRTMKSTNQVAAADRISKERAQWGAERYDTNVTASAIYGSKAHTPEQSEAAQIFIRNIVDPKPVPLLPKSSSAAARAYEAAVISRNLKLSAATAVLSRAYADRKMLPESTTLDSRPQQNLYGPATGK